VPGIDPQFQKLQDDALARGLRADKHGQITEGPSVVQLAGAATLVKNILARIAESLRLQLTRRALDRELGTRFPHQAWSRFCQPGKWDSTVAHTGKGSLAMRGLAPYFPRELRDVDDAREKLGLCKRLPLGYTKSHGRRWFPGGLRQRF
jgi:hypothetical protein